MEKLTDGRDFLRREQAKTRGVKKAEVKSRLIPLNNGSQLCLNRRNSSSIMSPAHNKVYGINSRDSISQLLVHTNGRNHGQNLALATSRA